jgi:site-specific recombinase XerD
MTDDNGKFLAAIKYYLTDYLPLQKGASPHTIKSYTETLNQYFDQLQLYHDKNFSELTLEMINKPSVTNYLNWIEDTVCNSVSTRNQRLASIKSFVSHISVKDILLKTQFQEIRDIPSKTDRLGKPLLKFVEDKVIIDILSQPDSKTSKGLRDKFLMSLLYDSATRIQELLNLKIYNLFLNSPEPYIQVLGKGSKPRLVPIMPNTVKLNTKYLELFHENSSSDHFLFYVNYKKMQMQMTQACATKIIAKYYNQIKNNHIGIPDKFTPHMFRHSRAMSLYKSGMPLPLISEWLGHGSLEVTLIYANADIKMKSDAIDKATNQFNPLKQKLPTIPVLNNNDMILKKFVGLK